MKIQDKEEFLKKINDKKWFSNHQLKVYYHLETLVDSSLLGDKDVALALLEKMVWSFSHFSKELRDDDEIVEKALSLVSEDCLKKNIFRYASPRFRNNLELLDKYNCYYEVYPQEVNDDESLMMKLILKERAEYKDCSLRLRKMSEFLPFCKDYNDLPDEYRNNKELLKKVLVNSDFQSLKNFPAEYKCDKNFLLDALALSDDQKKKNFGDHSRNIDKELLDDYSFMEIVLKQAGKCLACASDRIKNDKKMVEIAINNNPSSLIACTKEFIDSNDDLVEKALKLANCNDMDWVVDLPDKYFRVKEYAMKIAGTDFTFDKLSDELKKDPDIRKAWNINEDNLSYIYYWYHGFYTKKEQAIIREALENKDYDSFMKIYKIKSNGLPGTITVYADAKGDSIYLGEIDISKENFLKITDNESEAG